jgi:4'-phosphopantetheinyl transferase EntD
VGVKTVRKYQSLVQVFRECIPPNFGFSLVDLQAIRNFKLHSLEERCLSMNASSKRKSDFKLGRAAGLNALRNLGVVERPILKSEQSYPLWQDGVVGSITHKNDIGIAVVAPSACCRTLGIDLESITGKYDIEFYKRIFPERELSWILEKNDEQHQRFCMVFSAKESLYKLVTPVEGLYIRYKDVELTWCEDKKNFTGTLRRKIGTRFDVGYRFTIHCTVHDGYVFSFAYIPSNKQPGHRPGLINQRLNANPRLYCPTR